jgi:hypothetical protein
MARALREALIRVTFPARRPRVHRAAAVIALALALAPLSSVAEKFVYLGTQPDGVELFVQASPPASRTDGKRQGWFRTVPATPQRVKDEYGFERQYDDMLALNVADCTTRSMGVTSIVYRDDKGAALARFERPADEIEYRKVKPATLGDTMLDWLCAASKKPSSPPAPSPGTASPFK